MPKNILLLCLAALTARSRSLPGSGNSVGLNGSGRYFTCGTADRGITNSVTVEAWIKSTSFQAQYVLLKYSDGNFSDSGFQFGTAQGRAVIKGRSKVGYYLTSGQSATLVCDGRRHHLAGQAKQNVWRIYVNSVLENSAAYSYSGGNLRTPAATPISGYPYLNGFYFQGDLDEVRLWRTVRTTTEIQQNMCRKFATAPADLVAYYRFDQTSGTTATDQGSQPTNGRRSSTDSSYKGWVEVVR